METKYLITYRESGDIEGFVDKESDIDKWLSKHNKRRKEEGSCKEYKDEFKIQKIWNLIENERS